MNYLKALFICSIFTFAYLPYNVSAQSIVTESNRVAIGVDDFTSVSPFVSFFVLGNGQFDGDLGVNQMFTNIDLNLRNDPGNPTIFQIEDSTGVDLLEVNSNGSFGINATPSNVTLNVRNTDLGGENNIIMNVEKANGDNIIQIQNDDEVVITGDFSVSGSKNFIMDHPLDPANKTLSHNAVESPDHVTYYHGTVQLNGQGEAVVDLPDYFEALNTDFHYQLTCIGAFAQVYISHEIENNRFSIAGGSPGMKVSWQISATRNDPWVQDHPYQAEKEKDELEKGKYYYPEGYGLDRTFRMDNEMEEMSEEN